MCDELRTRSASARPIERVAREPSFLLFYSRAPRDADVPGVSQLREICGERCGKGKEADSGTLLL